MQLAISGFGIEIPEKRINTKNIILTDRDFEILEFIMDMKFSGLEDVFEKFFKVTRANDIAKSMEWARKRLLQLEQAKYLRSVRSFSESTRFFVATLKAYHVLANHKPGAIISKPSQGIDQRTFIHDKLVLSGRRQLEEDLKVTSWISDRKLRSSTELSGGLTALYVPDGIYTLPTNQKVAFELEIAVKAKGRYHDKVKKYVQLMRTSSEQHKIF